MLKIEILPSLLAANQANLGEACQRVAASGADALHLDIMDGHFVPNLSFGPDTSAMARRVLPANYPINTHLMVTTPEHFAARFIERGSTTVQFHVEADSDIPALAEKIHQLGARAGLAINPDIPASRIMPFIKCVDEVLCMTVFPGYGGQSFIADVLPKITEIRQAHPELDIMVDGGINFETAEAAAKAGANQFVAGSFLFKQADMAHAVTEMRQRIRAVLNS